MNSTELCYFARLRKASQGVDHGEPNVDDVVHQGLSHRWNIWGDQRWEKERPGMSGKGLSVMIGIWMVLIWKLKIKIDTAKWMGLGITKKETVLVLCHRRLHAFAVSRWNWDCLRSLLCSVEEPNLRPNIPVACKEPSPSDWGRHFPRSPHFICEPINPIQCKKPFSSRSLTNRYYPQ